MGLLKQTLCRQRLGKSKYDSSPLYLQLSFQSFSYLQVIPLKQVILLLTNCQEVIGR